MNETELTQLIHQVTPFIKLLNIEVVQAKGDGYVETRMAIGPEFTQHLGHAHGGVIGTLADFTANLACKTPTITVEYKINFLAPAVGHSLVGRGTVLKEGKTLVVVRVDVLSLDGDQERLVASCLATLMPSRKA